MFNDQAEAEKKPVTAQQVVVVFGCIGTFFCVVFFFVEYSLPHPPHSPLLPLIIGLVFFGSIIAVYLAGRSQIARSRSENVAKRLTSGALNFSAERADPKAD